MLNNQTLTARAASYKKDSRKEFDKAVSALIALAFGYKRFGADFLWDADPELNDEANRICRNLSDALAELAKRTAKEVMDEKLDNYDFDTAWEAGNDEYGTPVLTRFDQQGSFLKELLEVWVALAFVYSIPESELRVLVSRYLSNPYASNLWRGIPRDILKWGKGYARNIADQITLIGQDAIVAATRNAEWQNAMADGAQYYIRRRGSYYDCDECQEMANTPIPIEIPFEIPHARCMCYPEYHYKSIEE